MITTAQAICTRALRAIGKAAGGQVVNSDDMNDAYEILQAMIDNWLIDGLTILVNQIQDFPLVSGQQDYTIGSGGNFNTTRPINFMNYGNLSIIDTNNNPDLELPISKLTIEQWQALPTKATQSALPTGAYYEESYPLGTFKFYPVPNVGYLNVRLYLPTRAINNPFTTLTTSVDIPPGYKIAIWYNLAVLIGPEFGAPLDPVIATKAAEFLGDLRRNNIKPVLIRVDDALIRTSDQFNYLTGNSGPQYGGQ